MQQPTENLRVPRREEFEDHYGYRPPEFTGTPVQLGLNWDHIKKIVLLAHNAAGANFTEAAGVDTGDGQQHAVLADTQLTSSLGELSLTATKETASSQSLYVRLTKPVPNRFDLRDSDENTIGNLILRKVENTWDLKHRWVQRRFENQSKESASVGRVLLETAEQVIQGYADKTGHPQTITAEAGQLNVIIWLCKSGYVPVSDDDRKKLEMLFSLSDELTIQDIPNTDPNSGFGKWCIYRKENATKIASGDLSVSSIDSQFRIKMKKIIPISERSLSDRDGAAEQEIKTILHSE